MKTQTVKVDTYECTNYGFKYVGSREEEYPDDRHSKFCSICGFSGYPECRKWCHNERFDREREAKQQTKQVKSRT